MSMFDQNSNTSEQSQDLAEVKLDDLVGEGKKYATVEDLAKGYAHASSHISKLETENSDFRIKVEANKSVEQILAEMQKGNRSQSESTDNTAAQDPDNSSNESVDIAALLKAELDKRDATQLANSNKAKVTSALQAKYGTKAGEMFEAKAKELNLDLEELSAQAPDLVLQSFGVTGAAPSASASAPTGDVRAQDKPSGVTAEAGTKAYLRQMREAGKLTRQEYYAACHQAISDDAVKFKSQV